MAKKKETKYFPTDLDIINFRFCHDNNIAFSIQKVSEDVDRYYVVKYNPKKYNDVSYMRKNTSIQASFTNRLTLTENEAWKKVFEYYHKTKLNIEGIKEENKKEYIKMVEIPKQLNNQINLIDMIAEVEKENKDLIKKAL